MNRTYPQNDGRRPPQPSLSSSTLLVPFLTQSPSPALSNSVLRWSRDQMFFRNCRFSREATAAGCFSEAYLRAFFCSYTCDVEPTQRYAIVFYFQIRHLYTSPTLTALPPAWSIAPWMRERQEGKSAAGDDGATLSCWP